MDPSSTINPAEVVWTVFGLVACTGHLYRLRNAILDRQYQIRHHVNGGKSRLVRSAIRRQATCALVQAIFVGIGLYAMALPPNPYGGSGSAYFTGVLIIGAELLLVFNSVQDYRDDRELTQWVVAHPPTETAR